MRYLIASLICILFACLVLLVGMATAGTFTSQAGFEISYPWRMAYDRPIYLPDGTVLQKKADVEAYLGRIVDNELSPCAERNGIDPHQVPMVKGIPIEIKDGFNFPCPESDSPTKMCAGEAGKGFITVALYNRGQALPGEFPFPANFAPHTFRTNYQFYLKTGVQGWLDTAKYVNWGYNPTAPALCHEWCHFWADCWTGN